MVVNFWGSWCAPCRAEADDLESRLPGHQGPGRRPSSASTSRTAGHGQGVRAGPGHLSEHLRPVEQAALALDFPPNSDAGDAGDRPARPDRRGDPGRRQAGAACNRSSSGSPPRSGAELMGDTFRRAGPERAAAARHRRGGARRPGQLPVAVRAAAGSRLPVLRDRPGRRRPRAPTGTAADSGQPGRRGASRSGSGSRESARSRAGCSPARCCSSPASPSSSSATAILFAGIGQVVLRATERQLEIVVGALIIVLGLGLSRADPGPAAGVPDQPAAVRRAARRAGLRRGLRAVAGCPAPARPSAR